jgi:alpha-galactosidase/6-phospho-beta-glucosidase family protein
MLESLKSWLWSSFFHDFFWNVNRDKLYEWKFKYYREHSKLKYKERYGGELTDYDYQNLIEAINRDEYEFIETSGDDRIKVEVEYEDEFINLIYHTKFSIILTIVENHGKNNGENPTLGELCDLPEASP